MRGLRVLHLSAPPYDGGVAEILRPEIPLLRDPRPRCGVAADSRDERSSAVTKTIHNGLQGADHILDSGEGDEYLHHSDWNASEVVDEYERRWSATGNPSVALPQLESLEAWSLLAALT